MSDVDTRLNCLNNVMYGDVEHGATVGAMAGGAVGAGIGYLEDGPRGAIIGALSGAGVGGLTGGAAAYFAYNEQRSGGDAEVMAQNAEADLEAENRQEETLIETYHQYLEQEEQKISQLQFQIDDPAQPPAQKAAVIQQLQQEDNDVKSKADIVQKTLPAIQNVNTNFHAYAQDPQSTPEEFANSLPENDQNLASIQVLGAKLVRLASNATDFTPSPP